MAERYNKAQLVEDLSLHIDVQSKAAAVRIIDFITETIAEQLAQGNDVTIGSFGKFEKTKDGKPTGIIVPKFAAFKDLKEAVA